MDLLSDDQQSEIAEHRRKQLERISKTEPPVSGPKADLTGRDLEALRYAVPAVEDRVAEQAIRPVSRFARRMVATGRTSVPEQVQTVIDAYAHLTRLRELAQNEPSARREYARRFEIAASFIELETYLIKMGRLSSPTRSATCTPSRRS